MKPQTEPKGQTRLIRILLAIVLVLSLGFSATVVELWSARKNTSGLAARVAQLEQIEQDRRDLARRQAEQRQVQVAQMLADATRVMTDSDASDQAKAAAWRTLRMRAADSWTDAIVAEAVRIGTTSTDPMLRADIWRQAHSNHTHPLLLEPLMTALAEDSERSAREEAAETLDLYLDQPGVVDALRAASETDPDPGVRGQAMASLSQVRSIEDDPDSAPDPDAVETSPGFSGMDPGAYVYDARPSSDQAAADFDEAARTLGELHVIDFETLAEGPFDTLEVAPGVTVSQSGTTTEGGIVSGCFMDCASDVRRGYNVTPDGDQYLGLPLIFGVGTATIDFDFETPIRSFGTYVIGLGTANGDLYLEFDDGTPRIISVSGAAQGGVQFVGFTAESPITRVRLALRNVVGGSRDNFSLDDVRYAVATSS